MMSEGTRAEVTNRLEAALAAGELVAQATLLAGPGRIGTKVLILPEGTLVGSLNVAGLDEQVRGDAVGMMEQLRGQLARTFDYRLEVAGEPLEARVFIEVFPPPPHLVIFGGVHVAIPLAAFAKTLGFQVTVADPRTKFANRQRFPHADTIIPEWPQKAVEQIEIGPSTYCVILTHDPKIDEPALKAVVPTKAAYIGAIGSRKTHAERFERMARHGVSAEELAAIYAPIGLDLNAQTPEEIALAVMAEIVAVRRGGTGGFMKDARPAT
ncbi:MAG TPA: XdhC family protein [Ardenticatenaceae bacterium]|nr:XdhC family protein [Ardenticatenaceae bacterium]